ncbi:hypothetical protein NEHOM01_1934 [Nematocida homosporus]|uniref:uncharacterized protein n=1 Tax=Nematocida homosporus TaxID=1912981 RepID=UPI00221EFCEF|nr:uncharacterized protein NEHOM01_1934 [Nematocida homosporus]KAI5187103.1 hypothetical protein NEHOM01_1934 [Nematocida homosporus]
MESKKTPFWLAYLTTAIAVGYATYKYIKYKTKSPLEIKEDGTAYYLAQNYEEALKQYTHALSLLGPIELQPDLAAKLCNNISQTHLAMKNYQEVLTYAEQTLKLNPLHMNTFNRLAKLEKLDKGYGGLKGLAVITAYLIIKKHDLNKQATPTNTNSTPTNSSPTNSSPTNSIPTNSSCTQYLNEWHNLLDVKIAQLAKEQAALISSKTDTLVVPFVKLEEILLIFKETLRDPAFGEASAEDIQLLTYIDGKTYTELIKSLEKSLATQRLTKRSRFVIGNIRFIQDRPEEAIKFLKSSDTIYGDVLSIYIQKFKNIPVDMQETQLASFMKKKDDPIVRMYLAQIYLTSDNMGQYLVNILELENEGEIVLPFIANAKSQFSLGEHQEAIKTIQKALRAFPDDINALCAAIELYSQIESSNVPTLLQEVIDRLSLKRFANSPRALFFLYIGHTTLNNTEEANKCLEKAINMDPYNGSLLLQKAQATIAKGNPDGFSLFQKAAELSPDLAEEIFRVMLTYQSIYLVQEIYPEVSALSTSLSVS